jgi:hypothetical protein
MANYVIEQARYDGERLVEVDIRCADGASGPSRSEGEVVPVSDVVHRLKQGDKVTTIWVLPLTCAPLLILPVEVVILPDGRESIELDRRGRPSEGLRMVSLPRLDR